MGADGHRKAKKKKPVKGPAGEGEALRAEKVFRLLQDLYRKLVGDPRGAEQGFTFRFDPRGDPASFAGTLLETLQSGRNGGRGLPDFVEGRVFCHHCDSPFCDHAFPPSHLSVFRGFTPTGFPLWSEFFDAVLEESAPRIDGLVVDPPDVVALHQTGDRLAAEQLPVFGRHSVRYHILGQVVAGYLPFPGRDLHGRFALTVQAVRHLNQGRERISLNLIGKIPGGDDIHQHLRLHPDSELVAVIAKARKRTGDLAVPPPHGKVDSILTRLAREIEKIHRRGRRRTRHAAARGEQRRAVGLALRDIERAAPDRFFIDSVEKTFIVVGPKWRIHVFGNDGRHVTSMNLSKEGVQKRVDLGRWRSAGNGESEALKRKIAGASS